MESSSAILVTHIFRKSSYFTPSGKAATLHLQGKLLSHFSSSHFREKQLLYTFRESNSAISVIHTLGKSSYSTPSGKAANLHLQGKQLSHFNNLHFQGRQLLNTFRESSLAISVIHTFGKSSSAILVTYIFRKSSLAILVTNTFRESHLLTPSEKAAQPF